MSECILEQTFLKSSVLLIITHIMFAVVLHVFFFTCLHSNFFLRSLTALTGAAN